jgi:UDP-glucose 4-epimerase
MGDIRDCSKLDGVLAKYKPLAIIHFAAAIAVSESFRDPSSHYDDKSLEYSALRAVTGRSYFKLVFSSTRATYGIPSSIRMDEAQAPINPYGQSKLIVEQILRDRTSPRL